MKKGESNMRYKKIIAVILMALLMVGCQKTPDHSAVVNNENGLKEDLIIDPLKEGEKRKTDIPATWKFSEKKSNDRVNISADLPLKNDEIGNLPIYEIKSHEMSTEELKKLTLYFADEDKLYAPSVFTKDVYQGIIDRINNNEGAYANLTLAMVYPDIRSALQQAVEIAPENEDDLKNVEIKFDQKIEDPALDKALSWSGASRGANLREKIWFEADVGEQRSSHIEAETYKNGLNNESKFIWKEGSSIASSDWLKGMLMHNNYNAESEYKENFEKLINKYLEYADQGSFNLEQGETQADQILKDLAIKNVSLSSYEKGLWFPKGAMPDNKGAGLQEDELWQADLEQAEVGYRYVFSQNIEGLNVEGGKSSSVAEESSKSYAPPFSVETVTIVVTQSGVKYFGWNNLSEKVATVADNTKLAPFDYIQKQLVNQVFYYYASQGQPASDTTKYNYSVVDAHLGYTNIPAYEKPENAWLVPAWFFTVRENTDGKDNDDIYFIFDALEGRVITW